MAWIVLGVALLVGFVLVARWFVNAEPATVWKVLRWGGLIAAALMVVAIVATGRWSWLWTIAVFGLPWLLRLRAVGQMRRNAHGPRPGQASAIETRFLRMTLDHDSGEMDGEIREGPAAGRRLSELSLGDLIALWRLCAQEDDQSRAVLETYLDRTHTDWRAVAGAGPAGGGGEAGAGGPGRSGTPGPMDAEEAREVLGVGPEAGPEEIERAYRRAMKVAHPDHGGSDWMAAKVNQAREVLLGRRR